MARTRFSGWMEGYSSRHGFARLHAEVLKAVGDPEVRRKLEELGFAVRGSSAEELRAMTRDQLARYECVIREIGIVKE